MAEFRVTLENVMNWVSVASSSDKELGCSVNRAEVAKWAEASDQRSHFCWPEGWRIPLEGAGVLIFCPWAEFFWEGDCVSSVRCAAFIIWAGDHLALQGAFTSSSPLSLGKGC